MAGPILPRNAKDPTAQDRRERSAMATFADKLRRVRRLYRSALDGIPREVITTNASTYEYRVDESILSGLLDEIAAAVDRIMLEGGPSQMWFSQQYVIPAYQQGTAQQWANLGAQSKAYELSRQTLEQVLLSPAYQRRIGLIRAREFELMKGFTAETKSRMSFVLTDGMAAGKGPLDIARDLAAQTDIDIRRAQRIARTEVPGAFRRARLEEATQAQQEFGWESREMHLSALSPTTRETHKARHGKLYTVGQQRLWWSQDGNGINCKCSTVTVLVDADGNPLAPGVVERARKMLES